MGPASTDWVAGRERHIELADYAADVYSEYGSSNAATTSYMEFEESCIVQEVDHLHRRQTALDLGCGEGRITFLLAERFNNVAGYDMSEGMIRTAGDSKLLRGIGNCSFEVRELEADLLHDWPDSSVCFVTGSFGMGSFFETPERLFREVHRVLRPEGRAIFSFYNSESLVASLPLPDDWEASLAAMVGDDDSHGLIVRFGNQSFDISARAYSPSVVRAMLRQYFRRCHLRTYPTLSAILPQTISGHPDAVDVCQDVDSLLADSEEFKFGAYILASVVKGGGLGLVASNHPFGYARLLDVLQERRMVFETREHEPCQTMEDVRSVLEIDDRLLMKSVLIRKRSQHEPVFYLCVLAANRRVDYVKLARWVGASRSHLRLATQDEVLDETGFAVGSIPPMGMPPSVPVIFDTESLAAIADDEKLWIGSGKRTESIHLSKAELVRGVVPELRDISSEPS